MPHMKPYNLPSLLCIQHLNFIINIPNGVVVTIVVVAKNSTVKESELWVIEVTISIDIVLVDTHTTAIVFSST